MPSGILPNNEAGNPTCIPPVRERKSWRRKRKMTFIYTEQKRARSNHVIKSDFIGGLEDVS